MLPVSLVPRSSWGFSAAFFLFGSKRRRSYWIWGSVRREKGRTGKRQRSDAKVDVPNSDFGTIDEKGRYGPLQFMLQTAILKKGTKELRQCHHSQEIWERQGPSPHPLSQNSILCSNGTHWRTTVPKQIPKLGIQSPQEVLSSDEESTKTMGHWALSAKQRITQPAYCACSLVIQILPPQSNSSTMPFADYLDIGRTMKIQFTRLFLAVVAWLLQ